MNKGFSRTFLKMVAICAMVCDHLAWGIFDGDEPAALIMHIIGRLTLPIMCFFVAEGFRKTSDIKKYIGRMVIFWIISAGPFYIYFSHMYGFRQNIIFDLLLGLLVLYTLENTYLSRSGKSLAVTVLLMISIAIGGWVILPTLYILIFYYGKDFKDKAKNFCMVTVLSVILLAVLSEINTVFHIIDIEWRWYNCIYFLGFMLALIPLKFYNGKNGESIFSNMFFYCFYPIHFLLLYLINNYMGDWGLQEIYIYVHLVPVVMLIVVLFMVMRIRPSVVQSATIVTLGAALIYYIGFILEITSDTVDGALCAVKMQYFGECILIIGFTWLMMECCKRNIPKWFFVIEIIFDIFFVYVVFTTEENRFFYEDIKLNCDGPFPRIELVYGTGFYLFVMYLLLICVVGIIIGASEYMASGGIERKRLKWMLLAIVFPWIPNFIRQTGITGGYEIPFIGIAGSVICICVVIIQYGYFDSVAVARDNALKNGHEGILVISNSHRILYCNTRIEEIFGEMKKYADVYTYMGMRDIFEGKKDNITIGEKTYELRVEPLTESGYTQGYMLWVLDMTMHYNELKEVKHISNTDSLTGISNRGCYEELVKEYMKNDGYGAMFMLDLDDFKNVNDTYGHSVGDEVLLHFAEVISEIAGNDNYVGRIGGDEFSAFFKDVTSEEKLSKLAEQIINGFAARLEQTDYGKITAASIGIAILDENSQHKGEKLKYINMFNRADKALYLSKNSGKSIYKFY